MRAFTTLRLFALWVLGRALSEATPLYSRKERHAVPEGWNCVRKASSSEVIRLRIGLKQEGFDELEKQLYEISNPVHPRFRQHLSAEEVDRLVQPSEETVKLVQNWLAEYGIDRWQLSFSKSRDWILASVRVSQAEKLLNTSYFVYRHTDSSLVIGAPEWSLPAHLHQLIDTIQPTTSFFRTRQREQRAVRSRDGPDPPPALDGAQLADEFHSGLGGLTAGIDLANPPSDLSPFQVCNESAVTPLCLRTLYGLLGYKPQATDHNKMAVTNYLGEFNNRSDTRLYLQTYRPDAIAAADTFAAIEIAGGTNQQTPATTSQLQRGAGKEGNLDAQIMLGLAHPVPLITYSTGTLAPPPAGPEDAAADEPFLSWLQHVLALPDSELPSVVSTSYGDVEEAVPPAYARRVCQDFAQLGARGVSVIFGSGDSGVAGGRDGRCDADIVGDGEGNRKVVPRFAPHFPDSCPYVTSVGATRGILNGTRVAYNEKNGFVSGGGFSRYFSRPRYQEEAVSEYLGRIGEELHAGSYDPMGRAYPDVAAMGYRMAMVWNGTDHLVDGTSASTPAFAAVVALVNDALVASGRPTLGFLNPWLYQLRGKGFTDVTLGASTGCNTSGFPATEGWDVASGLGTPWFPELKKMALGNRFRSAQPWYMQKWQ